MFQKNKLHNGLLSNAAKTSFHIVEKELDRLHAYVYYFICYIIIQIAAVITINLIVFGNKFLRNEISLSWAFGSYFSTLIYDKNLGVFKPISDLAHILFSSNREHMSQTDMVVSCLPSQLGRTK